MRIKLLKSHRGWETGEKWYPADTVVDLDSDAARALIKNGWAETCVKVVEKDSYSALTYSDLRKLAKKHGVNARGKRVDIVRRLNAIDIDG